MGYDPSTHSETVETKHGPAFEVEDGLTDGLTVWFRKDEWGDDETTGRKLTTEEARELARVLEEFAQHQDPISHA